MAVNHGELVFFEKLFDEQVPPDGVSIHQFKVIVMNCIAYIHI
jgi:hypothetical protein